MKRAAIAVCSILLLTSQNGFAGNSAQRRIDSHAFAHLMQTVADGWNEGDARKAADCYSQNATYTEPPDKQVYEGRNALYNFFGADKKPNPPMKMVWHHLAFNEEDQIGFGEYTFEMNHRYHGIVVVKIENGKIANWREYQYPSTLPWDQFQAKNKF